MTAVERRDELDTSKMKCRVNAKEKKEHKLGGGIGRSNPIHLIYGCPVDLTKELTQSKQHIHAGCSTMMVVTIATEDLAML